MCPNQPPACAFSFSGPLLFVKHLTGEQGLKACDREGNVWTPRIPSLAGILHSLAAFPLNNQTGERTSPFFTETENLLQYVGQKNGKCFQNHVLF